MDQHKLIEIIKQHSLIWDRTHPYFRDKCSKDGAWVSIGLKMGCSSESCRETFKSIREKYIREREKSVQLADNYREWELLSELKFLDPNIVPRKQSAYNEDDIQKTEEFCSQISRESAPNSTNQTDIDKAIINFVKKTTPIWDRNCNTYSNKQLKSQLWQNIGNKLNLDSNVCMTRWKALREKYIRQKTKYQQEGDVKWELLDEMSFLDRVIQYRKRQPDNEINHHRTNHADKYIHPIAPKLAETSNLSQESDSNFSQNIYDTGDDNSLYDSSNDFVPAVKQENTVFQLADSSYSCSSQRKRSTSINSEASVEKKQKPDQTETKQGKTPEELFGDLVAAMLSRKPDSERNLYMIEIMTVLSK